MTDLTTMIAALKAEDVDSVLKGTKYDLYVLNDDLKNAERWADEDPENEMEWYQKEIIAAQASQTQLIYQDAELNAAKVIVQAELIRVLVEALTNLVALYDDDKGCRQLLEYKAGKAALAAANEMKDA